MQSFLKYLLILLLALTAGGCSTTYVPISWGYGEKVKELSNSDAVLTAFFSRYDPERSTLRVGGKSFEEVMMPSEVQYHLGAYRPSEKLIYRNLYNKYNDKDLRDLLVHEFAHHIWFNFMTTDQRLSWRKHLALNPSPLQVMVRVAYSNPDEFDAEDFAYTVEFPRKVDIEKLAALKIITPEERDAFIKELARRDTVATQPGAPPAAVRLDLTKSVPQLGKQEEYDAFE